METELGAILPVWSAIPFAGVLLSIALFPLLAPVFWHHHFPKVSAAWSAVLVVPFVLAYGEPAVHELAHVAVADYVPFIILIATLFTIGAAMLMIRPLLRANRARRHRAHTIVFFIFLVANVGGALTPLGDPPLFLGFLHGVPFFWTFTVWKQTALVVLVVLGVYALHDVYYWRREDWVVREPPHGPREPLAVEGWHNLLLLGGVLGAVILSGVWSGGDVIILGVRQQVQNLVRDAILLAMLAGS